MNAYRTVVPVVALVLLAPVLAGQAAAIHDESSTSTPTPTEGPNESDLSSTQDRGPIDATIQTTRRSLSSNEKREDEDEADGAEHRDRDADSTRNGSVLAVLDPDDDWQLHDTADGTLDSPTDLVAPLGLRTTHGDVPSTSTAASDEAAGPDGSVGDRATVASQRGRDGPGVPDEVPDEGVPVSVGLGGIALAAAARRGLLVGGTVLAAPVGTREAVQGGFDRLVRVFYPLRYSRYDDSDPLEHDTRQQVHEVVDDNPGTYLSAVSERAGVPLSTARHHVRILEREGLVASAKVRGKRRFYPADLDDVARAAAIDDGAAATVLDALARLGPSSVAELATELDRDPSTVTYHLQRLEEDDLVERERVGRSVENRLTDALRAALDPGEAGAEPAPVRSPADD